MPSHVWSCLSIVESYTYSPQRAGAVMYMIFDGLSHIHAKQVIHRDLKSDNILLDASGNIKISDFGLAEDCGHGKHLIHQAGARSYRSPEMEIKYGYDHKHDVWVNLSFQSKFIISLSNIYIWRVN